MMGVIMVGGHLCGGRYGDAWFERVFLRILENSWARSVGERV